MVKMKIFNAVDSSMVTVFVDRLPKWCQYCGRRCWQTDDYPYACRCSECSAYFHLIPWTCSDLEDDIPHTCISDTLRLFELTDGRLVEVCQVCAEWLYEEGFIEDLPNSER
jgi:hypothetical protein